VVVAVNGVEAGYIRAVDCREFEWALFSIGADAAECEARIVGGWKRPRDFKLQVSQRPQSLTV
jgi:hypothetical protein